VAKLIAENIVLVSLCPRLDDASGNIRRGNIIIEKLANDENCHLTLMLWVLYVIHVSCFHVDSCLSVPEYYCVLPLV
jgi:hypothetical protein